jgi:hypothetical protein
MLYMHTQVPWILNSSNYSWKHIGSKKESKKNSKRIELDELKFKGLCRMNRRPHFYIHWMIKADEDLKRQYRMNRWSFIGSSDSLGFQHNKVWGSSASAMDEPAVLASVHLAVVS